MPKRILTVSYIIEREVTLPFIRLRGRWLTQAGFHPQDQIEVEASHLERSLFMSGTNLNHGGTNDG